MSRTVFIHIGAPKTGTTYVQDRLFLNREELARHSVHYPLPGGKTAAHFHAALDLLELPGGYEDTTGHWDALARQVNRLDGTVIISHEILAPAPAAAINRALRDLTAIPDTELHVVYTARDIGRQIPAAWQESIKQGRPWPYRRFVRKVRRSGNPWFYRAFDLPTVLEGWCADLPADRVHLITVPQPGAEPGLLWQRFCDTLGIDPTWAPQEAVSRNPSLGAVETEVIRKLNRRFDYETRRHTNFDQLIREHLANTELSQQASYPVRLPPRLLPWAQEQAERWIVWTRESGIHVVGDLDELRPRPLGEGEVWLNPDKVPPKRQARVAIDALASMTREAARRPDPDRKFVTKAKRQAAARRES